MNLDEAEKLSADMRTAHLIKTLNDRVQELEAMLEAVGAGGVSAQRVTQGKDHIEQPLEMVAAPVVLPEPVAVQIRHIKEERWRTIALVLYDLFAGDEYERRYIYTEQQVRELLAKATCTKSQTQEPFGYFKAEPFGWRDCADTDEGAIALYEAPPPQADALDAVNLDRLGKALTKLGHATWVSQEEAAADIPRWVNALTSCVLEIPEAAPQTQAVNQEPFGYVTHYGRFVRQLKDIRADDRFNRFKWRAVFAAPQPQADARDAERWRFIKRKLCLTGNGDGTCAMQALNLPARILGWPDVGELAIAQFLDGAIDAAIAAAKEI